MTNHAAVGLAAAQRLAGEVRAEMARQKRTAGEMARVLGITAHTAGRRLSGAVAFSVTELMAVAMWLGMDAKELLRRAEEPAHAVAS
ncbi:transcriptional regulator with XRE-family HTH domain [Microbacterium testaceum]|uniref:helix-turn-helix domain-containing protein n=1 Tax=Microbacterium sp. 1154 TaxID=2817733 RepID=UPI002784F928|nr:helix-turn-helix domain-containing protein [Microbacterium sp. 1154]MDQ1111205.1 transcriptional regulator with XRE-family HTH domain [Microbacterium testaceum]MDR6098256.1 transcriptional regulator with XRE-family HTH domain [Microbacterium sp. SORGH_AS_0454]MDR6691511.1 transcriptional regulator with XRE-family HTH domain [Microbacterium sp. 1154]